MFIMFITKFKQSDPLWIYLLLCLGILITGWQLVTFPTNFWRISLMFAFKFITFYAILLCFANNDNKFVGIFGVWAGISLIAFIYNIIAVERISDLDLAIRWLFFGLLLSAVKIAWTYNISKGLFKAIIIIDVIIHLGYIELAWGLINAIESVVWFMS